MEEDGELKSALFVTEGEDREVMDGRHGTTISEGVGIKLMPVKDDGVVAQGTSSLESVTGISKEESRVAQLCLVHSPCLTAAMSVHHSSVCRTETLYPILKDN